MMTIAYGCYNLDENDRLLSSSGGIYPLIAKEILKMGGVIYAACYDNNLDVVHKRITHMDDIKDSQGSKYVVSSLESTFNNVLKEINNGKRVLFVGTPCQCSGLNSLIHIKKANRSLLILVDFVCHGIPGKVPWNAYKKSLESNGKQLISVNMRNKSTGWSNGDYSWREEYSDGTYSIIERRNAPYLKGMLANLYIRPSCFECPFKGIERQTDITLGDYWGVWNHLPNLDDNKGTSLVLIHTETGKQLFQSLTNKINYSDANIEKAIEGNSCLIQSTKYNPKREEFFKRLNMGQDFTTIIDELTKVSFSERFKRKVKKTLKTVLFSH